MSAYLLSLAIWAPIFGGLLVFVVGSERAAAAPWLALIVSLAGFAVTLPLYAGFDPREAGMQFIEQAPWIGLFRAQYLLGVDGISMLFLLLNSFITILVVLAG